MAAALRRGEIARERERVRERAPAPAPAPAPARRRAHALAHTHAHAHAHAQAHAHDPRLALARELRAWALEDVGLAPAKVPPADALLPLCCGRLAASWAALLPAHRRAALPPALLPARLRSAAPATGAGAEAAAEAAEEARELELQAHAVASRLELLEREARAAAADTRELVRATAAAAARRRSARVAARRARARAGAAAALESKWLRDAAALAEHAERLHAAQTPGDTLGPEIEETLQEVCAVLAQHYASDAAVRDCALPANVEAAVDEALRRLAPTPDVLWSTLERVTARATGEVERQTSDIDYQVEVQRIREAWGGTDFFDAGAAMDDMREEHSAAFVEAERSDNERAELERDITDLAAQMQLGEADTAALEAAGLAAALREAETLLDRMDSEARGGGGAGAGAGAGAGDGGEAGGVQAGEDEVQRLRQLCRQDEALCRHVFVANRELKRQIPSSREAIDGFVRENVAARLPALCRRAGAAATGEHEELALLRMLPLPDVLDDVCSSGDAGGGAEAEEEPRPLRPGVAAEFSHEHTWAIERAAATTRELLAEREAKAAEFGELALRHALCSPAAVQEILADCEGMERHQLTRLVPLAERTLAQAAESQQRCAEIAQLAAERRDFPAGSACGWLTVGGKSFAEWVREIDPFDSGLLLPPAPQQQEGEGESEGEDEDEDEDDVPQQDPSSARRIFLTSE